jgi:hypothetical protein
MSIWIACAHRRGAERHRRPDHRGCAPRPCPWAPATRRGGDPARRGGAYAPP